MILPSKRELFGVNVSVTRYDEVVERVIAMAKAGRAATVDFMCVHGLVHAAGDARFREVINAFDIVATDGQPVRWAMNKFHDANLTERVYGPETMWRTCAAAAREGVSIYLYGAGQDVIDTLVKLLPEKHPGLKIAGAESPPFRKLSAEEEAETARRINASGAGIVFIGIGCPKQEEFAWRNRHAIKGVQMCVGAAFDMHAGTKPMAPRWMQKRGLEWLYRLGQEPGRLWKRYLVNNSLFLQLVIGRMLRGSRRRPCRRAELSESPS